MNPSEVEKSDRNRFELCTLSSQSYECHEQMASSDADDKNISRNLRLKVETEAQESVVEVIEECQTITVRSILVGLLASLFASAVAQFFLFKPALVRIEILFIQIVCLLLGRACSLIPGPSWWNYGEFSIKEVTFSTIMAASAASGAMGVEALAAQDLFFNKKLSHLLSLMILFSSQLVGYGFSGLLRPLLLHNSSIPFPSILPNVALFHSMSARTPTAKKQLSFFKKTLALVSIYEVFPTYIMPALQAISPWCLVMPQVPAITNLFGGSLPGEGMGLFSISADWALVGSYSPLYVPLDAQINEIFSFFVSIFLFMAAYRYNFFGSAPMPFISFQLFDSHGKPYDTKRAIFPNGTGNAEVIREIGTPSYSISVVLAKTMLCMGTSASITTAIAATWAVYRSPGKPKTEEIKKRDSTIKKTTGEFHWTGYLIIFLFSVALAIAASQLSGSGLSILGLLVALSVAGLLSLTAGYFYGTVGIPLMVAPAVQMIGGLLFPGNALGNMWFTIYGSTSVMQSVSMLKDLKLGQYMQLTPVATVAAQLSGTFVGVIIHYAVMILLVSTQREALLLPYGNGIFSGVLPSIFAVEATAWGVFGREMFFPGKRYFILPIALFFGLFIPIPFIVIKKYRPRSILKYFNATLFCVSMAGNILTASAGRTVASVVGITSQFLMKKYRFGWFKKYNYILCAALDGGTQITVLLLGFILQGGAGFKVEFPTYALNPHGPRDYCVMPKAPNGH